MFIFILTCIETLMSGLPPLEEVKERGESKCISHISIYLSVHLSHVYMYVYIYIYIHMYLLNSWHVSISPSCCNILRSNIGNRKEKKREGDWGLHENTADGKKKKRTALDG